MATEPVFLDLPGGFLRTTSVFAARGRVIDGDKVRFQNGKWEKIGGWVKLAEEQLTGVARGAYGWTTTTGDNLIATGTATKLYSVLDMVQDITPLRTSGTLGTDPFAVTDGETTVTVTHTAHGLTDGATAHFSGASAGGGITIDGEYVITYVDADSYTIEHSSAATSTDSTTGGASVAYEYEINPGYQSSAYGVGYGAGLYGEGTYGTPRASGNGLAGSSGILNELRTWFFANYGTKLLVLPSGGTVYLWDQPASALRAVAVTNAPASARAMFITPERMIVALGTSLPMTMQWCDRESATNWTAGVGSTANTRTLQVGNKLIAGTTFTGGISLIWSDTALYLMQYIGATGEIYSTRVISEGCGLIGPCGFARSADLMAWMGNHDFFYYQGGLAQRCPRQDEIRDYILGTTTRSGIITGGRINRDYAAKVACGYNPKHNEFWWHYVSVDSTDGEPDEYVKVCLDDWSWDTGTLPRSAMTNTAGPAGQTVMIGTDGYVYRHEVGTDADGAALPWSLQTSPVPLGNAAADMDVEGFVPDFERQYGTIAMRLRTWERPMSAAPLDDNDYDIEEGDTLIDVRLGGRYADLKLSGDGVGCDFRLGIPQIEIGVAAEHR